MARDHKAASSSAATKTELDKPPIKQSGVTGRKPTRKQLGIICGVIAVLVAALAIGLTFILNRNQPQTETSGDTETTQDEPIVDYNQKITDKDGGEFKAEYQAGSEQSFAMRFSDLKCEDNCKNVSEVKLGDKTLKQGEDYKVESGSIIIVLTENFMKSLKADKYDLAIAVIDGDKTLFYGVKFTVKPEPTCGEGETLEKGKCVKKPEEQPTQGQTGNTSATTTKPSNSQSTTPPSQPATPSKSQAQINCENQTGPIGYTRIFRPQQGNPYGLPDWNMYWSPGGDYSFANGATTMVWVNGACHPHVKDVPATGSYAAMYTPEQFQQSKPDIYNMMISHPNEDLIVWYWGDWSNGRRTYEFSNNTYSIFNY